MGFLSSLFGIESEDDFPNGEKWKECGDYFIQFFVMSKCLSLKHGDKLPSEAYFILTLALITAAAINDPLDSFDATTLLGLCSEEGEDGKRHIREDDELLIDWVEPMADAKFKSQAARARALEAIREVRGDLQAGMDEPGGVDDYINSLSPGLVKAYNKSGLSDLSVCERYLERYHQLLMKM